VVKLVAQAFGGGKLWLGALIVAAGGTVACGTLQSASSGQIGCAEEDIKITNDSVGWSTRTWTAECHGKRFFCSAVQTGKEQSQVNCKEDTTTASAPPAPVAAAENGCKYDTQCKGDRVCVKGECVAPEPQLSKPTAEQAVSPSP
jgi:hypothetical protein